MKGRSIDRKGFQMITSATSNKLRCKLLKNKSNDEGHLVFGHQLLYFRSCSGTIRSNLQRKDGDRSPLWMEMMEWHCCRMLEVTFTIFKKFNLNSNNIIIVLSTVSYFWVQLVILVIKEKLNFCLEICIINSINFFLYPNY